MTRANANENGNDKVSVGKNISNDFEKISEIPLGVFQANASGLESISQYLKEKAGLRYCEIADILNRDDRTIWGAHQAAKEKSNVHANFDSSIKIPLSIFKDRKLSVLEAISEYLKEHHSMKFCVIARLLNKDQRTIWTVYNRAKNKRKNGPN